MVNPSTSPNEYLVQYYDELVEYVSFKIGNRQIALDVVQETYVRVFQRPEQFFNLLNPIAFLKKVSINIALDNLKKNKTYYKYFEFYEPDELDICLGNQLESKQLSDLELSVVKDQYARQILNQIALLPPACQDIFLLVQFYDMTQIEAGRQLGISRTMVIKHLTRALQSFVPIFMDHNI